MHTQWAYVLKGNVTVTVANSAGQSFIDTVVSSQQLEPSGDFSLGVDDTSHA